MMPARFTRSGFRRIFASREEVDADSEREETVRRGGTLIADLVPRHRATVTGVLRSTMLRPRNRVPALEAELYDGSGSLAIVWIGRREIRGVTPGGRIKVTGIISDTDGQLTIYNPRYELVPRGAQ